jgi:hypothetical protein
MTYVSPVFLTTWFWMEDEHNPVSSFERMIIKTVFKWLLLSYDEFHEFRMITLRAYIAYTLHILTSRIARMLKLMHLLISKNGTVDSWWVFEAIIVYLILLTYYIAFNSGLVQSDLICRNRLYTAAIHFQFIFAHRWLWLWSTETEYLSI